jgi:hypothetical protein
MKGVSTTLDEKTMHAIFRTGKTLLDAMAFANVSNLDEFRAMLRKVEPPVEPASLPKSDDSLPPPAPATVFPKIREAL